MRAHRLADAPGELADVLGDLVVRRGHLEDDELDSSALEASVSTCCAISRTAVVKILDELRRLLGGRDLHPDRVCELVRQLVERCLRLGDPLRLFRGLAELLLPLRRDAPQLLVERGHRPRRPGRRAHAISLDRPSGGVGEPVELHRRAAATARNDCADGDGDDAEDHQLPVLEEPRTDEPGGHQHHDRQELLGRECQFIGRERRPWLPLPGWPRGASWRAGPWAPWLPVP